MQSGWSSERKAGNLFREFVDAVLPAEQRALGRALHRGAAREGGRRSERGHG